MQTLKIVSLVGLIAAGYTVEHVQADSPGQDEQVQACAMPITPIADLQNITIGTNRGNPPDLASSHQSSATHQSSCARNNATPARDADQNL